MSFGLFITTFYQILALNTILSRSPEDTQEFAKNIVKKAKVPSVFLLFGDLGSGKTTFTQGFAQGLGIQQKIKSPSFAFLHRYQFQSPKTKKKAKLYHFDLYRLTKNDELSPLGFQEAVSDPEAITLVEWADRLSELPKNCKKIHFEYIDKNTRKITCK